jgi:Heparinase II/III N-terminus/Heparinase II/III-like protein
MVFLVLAVLIATPDTLPVELPRHATWKHARCTLTPTGEGLDVTYDFRNQPGGCWFRRSYEKGQDFRPYRYLRFMVRGDGSGITLRTHLIRFVDGAEVAFASEVVRVGFADTRTFSVDLTSLTSNELGRITSADLQDVRQVNFSLGPTQAQHGTITLTEIALTTDPEGTLVAQPASNASFADTAAFLDSIDWPEGVERSMEGFGRYLGERTSPRFFFDGRDLEPLVAVLKTRYPDWLRAKARDANERVLKRYFVFEGDARQLADPIQWHQGRMEWTNILNRLMYLESLYATYWATGDELYATDCVRILTDWIDNNPVPRFMTNEYGPDGNPWRSLETGIRCDMMLRAYQALLGSPSCPPASRAKVVRSLAEHGRYLTAWQNEFGYRPGNFQVVEATGLAMVGIMFPEFREATQWRDTGLHWLREHLERDVYEDGTHWEVTPGYHGWVAERLTAAWRLGEMNGVGVDPTYNVKLKKMYEFNLKIMSPTGHAPMNGDCGRYSLASRLASGALLFSDPALRFRASSTPSLDLVWLYGPQALKDYDTLPGEEPSFRSVVTPDSGYCIMRTGWEPDALWFFFDMVPYGGGHSHPDQLSFEFQAGPVLLLGDSGRVNYNQPLHREYMRAPHAHNVCAIDGAFADRSASPERLEWRETPAYAVARGRIAIGAHVWERGVLWVKPDRWIVRDLFRGQGTHKVERYFNHVPSYPGNVPEPERRAELGVPMDPGACITVLDGQRRTEPGHFGISASTAYDAETTVVTSQVEFPGVVWCMIAPQAIPQDAVSIMAADTKHLSVSVPGAGETARQITWRWPDGAGTSVVEMK